MELGVNITSLWTIILYTIRKLLLSRRIVITLLVIVFVCAITLYATTQDVDRLEDGSNLLDVLILFFFMPVMAMIYGSSLIRDEMDDQSITQVATAPMNRVWTYTGYFIGLGVSVSVVILLILTAGFLSFFGAMGIDSSALGIYGSMAAMVVIGSFVYSSLFIMVSVLINHPIYFGLVYAFIWEGFIGSLPGSIGKLAVKHYVRSLGAHWIDHGGIAEYSASSVADSAWVLVIFTIVMFVIGAFLFHEKEFT